MCLFVTKVVEFCAAQRCAGSVRFRPLRKCRYAGTECIATYIPAIAPLYPVRCRGELAVADRIVCRSRRDTRRRGRSMTGAWGTLAEFLWGNEGPVSHLIDHGLRFVYKKTGRERNHPLLFSPLSPCKSNGRQTRTAYVRRKRHEVWTDRHPIFRNC